MQISGPDGQALREELSVMTEKISFSGAKVLELGCGAAVRTQQIAEQTDVASIIAAEVDLTAHEKNLAKRIEKIEFHSFAAQEIPLETGSIDVVIMLKSLHHVPRQLMIQSLEEIHRVLRRGGLAYLSEPVFQGELNEVIRLFHDEEAVRKFAFDAIAKSIDLGLFRLVEEYFYLNPVFMSDFDQFRKAIMDATYQDHEADEDLVGRVRARFESYKSDDREAPYYFETPNRVDLLKKL